MDWKPNGKSLKFDMVEGEYFVAMVAKDGILYLKSNLGRYWKSTNAPTENIDFVEVEGE